MRHPSLALILAGALTACSTATPESAGGSRTGPPTAEEAGRFLADVNETMRRLGVEAGQAGWVSSTYITPDTEAMTARANQHFIEAVAKYAKDATRFDGLTLSADQRRQLNLLKLSLVMVTPGDSKEAEELTKIAAGMEGTYGRGTWCERADACLDIEKITAIMAENRDAARLEAVWEGWHTIAVPMKKDYVRFVELANKGAKELGFPDTGAMWRAKYDLPPDEFTKELDRLWEQVRPLYLSLHAYVRMKLRAKYGDAVPEKGPLAAHLLGNIWAQDWSNVYPLVAPPSADPGFDLTAILEQRKTTATQMTEIGERFFTSLGFAPLPQDLLRTIAAREARRSRGRLPCERVGHRPRRGPAHQDVHRRNGGRLHDDPPRARAQFLSARLPQAAGDLPRRSQRRLSRGDR